jgi:hypothetical protein
VSDNGAHGIEWRALNSAPAPTQELGATLAELALRAKVHPARMAASASTNDDATQGATIGVHWVDRSAFATVVLWVDGEVTSMVYIGQEVGPQLWAPRHG